MYTPKQQFHKGPTRAQRKYPAYMPTTTFMIQPTKQLPTYPNFTNVTPKNNTHTQTTTMSQQTNRATTKQILA
jgi:hypothetical protein